MSHLDCITAKWIREQIQTLQDAQSKAWKAEIADRISQLRAELNKAVSYK